MRLIKVALLALLSVMTYEVYAKRVALVIGNAAYEHENKLTNPVNDAVLLQSTLKNDLHFDNVKLVKNADFRTLNRTINEFNQTAQDADIAVIYFSGHGQQGADRQNYLLATDAHIENLVDLRTGAVTSDELINATQGAKARIVILDACRDRPNSGFKSATKGLSRVQVTGDELLIAYATDAGKVAQDGNTGNSPYATALAQVMRKKDKSIMGMFDEVKNQVRTMTKGQQVPTREGNLSINIYFIQPTINLQENTNSDAELVFWDSIKNETDAEGYQAYLKQYPNGRFSHLAQEKIQKYVLKMNQTQVASVNDIEKTKKYIEEVDNILLKNPINEKKRYKAAEHTLSQGNPFAEIFINAANFSGQNYKDLVTLADQNHAASANLLGFVWMAKGLPNEAMKWFHKSADIGHHFAMRELGAAYLAGLGVPKNEQKAMEWFKKSADLGNTTAMTAVGTLYRNAKGVTQNYNTMLEWYKKAADAGDMTAMMAIGTFYAKGEIVEQDDQKMLEWYYKAADAGDMTAMMKIGNFYAKNGGFGQNNQKAMEWYRKAVDSGDEEVINFIGTLYYDGTGVIQNYNTAMEWYLKAANLKSASAMYNIGILYEYGLGIEKDKIQAKEWYCKAAKLNHAEAITRVTAYGWSGNWQKQCV